MTLQDGLESKYLNPRDLEGLSHRRFQARRPVEGQFAGRHSSNQRGQSVEFADYREYTPGDELSDVDWKAYARTDRMYLKLFEHQSDMTVNLIVDSSKSMSYAGIDSTKTESKYDHACRLPATIAFMTLCQQDRVGLALAQNGLKTFIPPTGAMTGMAALLREMEHNSPDKIAKLEDSIDRVIRAAGRKGLLIIFSDLLEDRDPILKAIHNFQGRGGDVIVFHTLHRDELELPKDIDGGVFVDSESDEKLSINIPDIREKYQKRMQEFLDLWESTLTAQGVDYQLCVTDEYYLDPLKRYLIGRKESRWA